MERISHSLAGTRGQPAGPAVGWVRAPGSRRAPTMTRDRDGGGNDASVWLRVLKLGPACLAEDAGIYGLVLRLSRPRWVVAGKLGHRRLAAGWYVYVGSAKRNLAARLTRHLRHEKRMRWHIDYLRAAARVEEIWIWPWTEGRECRTSARIQALSGAGMPWRGFGSSDCGCASHLTVFAEKPAMCHGAGPIRLVANRGRFTLPRGQHLTPGSKGRILRFAQRSGAAKEQR